MEASPRKAAQESSSPRSAGVSMPTTPSPRSLHTFGPSATKPSRTIRAPKVTQLQPKMEVMELPSKLGLSANSLTMLKCSSSASRIRNGAGGDSSTRLPIECMTKDEISKEMKDSLTYYQIAFPDDDKEDLEEEDEDQVYSEDNSVETIMSPDKARFNVWKGTNYDLHVLGDFKTDLDRSVKAFRKPDRSTITMDPFCRADSGLQDEPARSDAFLVWKSNKSLDQWKHQFSDTSLQDAPSRGNLLVDDEEEEDTNCSDCDSLPDQEITEYLRGQKEKLKNSENITGETFYYDEEFNVVRNLHRNSHSLTNYGNFPDETYIGKAHLFYPEMTIEEKMMLKPVMSAPMSTCSPRLSQLKLSQN